MQMEALERWIPTMQATLDVKDFDLNFFFQAFDN